MHAFALNTPVVVKHKRDGRLIAGAVVEHCMDDLPGGGQRPMTRDGHAVYKVQIGPATDMQVDESQLAEVAY